MLLWWLQAGLVFTMLGGVVSLFVRGLWQMDTTSHSQYCACHTCSEKRRTLTNKRRAAWYAKRVRERHAREMPIPVHIDDEGRTFSNRDYLVTPDLKNGMIVRGVNEDTQYLIKSDARPTIEGYEVQMENVKTRQLFVFYVKLALCNRRMWCKLGQFHTTPPGRDWGRPPWM